MSRENVTYLEKDLEAAPFIHDPLQGLSGNAGRRAANNDKEDLARRRTRDRTPDSLDSILGPDEDSLDGFVEDDDGAGYAPEVNGNGKRPYGENQSYGPPFKRRAQQWQPEVHPSFQPGSSEWRGNRRYLCLNFVGAVWTVDQDSHYTVTVEFYDRDSHRDFHFTDTYHYDKACLTDKGTLFASPPSGPQPAQVYYGPHEHWTTERADWRTSLPKDESVIAISLGESFIVVTTSAGYVRIYTLFGTPYKIYRQKSTPAVTCASWRDYILTVGNGAVGGDGRTKLLYSIENVKRDDMCQSEDVVALAEGSRIQSVFFSDTGVSTNAALHGVHADFTGSLHLRHVWRAPSTSALADTGTSTLGTTARHQKLGSPGRWPQRGDLLASSSGG